MKDLLTLFDLIHFLLVLKQNQFVIRKSLDHKLNFL